MSELYFESAESTLRAPDWAWQVLLWVHVLENYFLAKLYDLARL